MPMKLKKNTSLPPSMDEVMTFFNAQTGKVGKRELARAFGLKGAAREALKGMLKTLRQEGKIDVERGGRRISAKNRLPEKIVVEITGMDSLGDLMARPNEWVSKAPAPQILITKDKLSPPAGVGDLVLVKIKSLEDGIYHAETLRRVSYGENQLVAVYENGRAYSVDKRIKTGFLLPELPRGVRLDNNDLILIEIPPVRSRRPEARFVKKIGDASAPFAPTLIAIYMHHLPVMFPEVAEKQAQKAKVPPLGKRRDLRDLPFVTIDGADARDFDDAVWAEADTDSHNKEGWHVMIAIADVAFYVPSGSALDQEARLRGNSVYFPDRVLPMLPEALSNGLCSLNPNETRAAFVCEAWLDKQGHKLKHRFHRALIRSARRLTYDEVQAHLDGQNAIEGLAQELQALVGAYHALMQRRQRRGVLEIDVPERQVVLNHQGRVMAIRSRQQLPSMQLIEEFMILANVAAAETLEDAGLPTMYRVHDKPSAVKIETLNAFLNSMGQKMNFSTHSEPRDYNALLQQLKGTAQERMMNEFVLRSQSQAEYSPENIGHFGLALQRYAHFTSPIRRYADIMVHRALITALNLGNDGLSETDDKVFAEVARHISLTERQAAAAEQDATDRYVALYLGDKIGQVFEGRVASVTTFGLFVHLDEYGADGLLPMRALGGDFFEYDERRQELIGRSTGEVYALGNTLSVVLRECDAITGTLVFSLKKNAVSHRGRNHQKGLASFKKKPLKRRG